MTEKECYGIVKTKLLPVFKNFIFIPKKYSGYCEVLYYNHLYFRDITKILDFIRKYSGFKESEQYDEVWWFKSYAYYPRYKLLKKAIKAYEEIRYLDNEYQFYLFTKNIVYREFKKIVGTKYPSIHSYLATKLNLEENDCKNILGFIETFTKENFDLVNLYNYSYRRKIIKKALNKYEYDNYI